MLIPVYLIFLLCALALFFRVAPKKTGWQKIVSACIFGFLVILLSFGDHVIGELAAKRWVAQSINPSICQQSSYSFLLSVDEHCIVRSKNVDQINGKHATSVEQLGLTEQENIERWKRLRKNRMLDFQMMVSEFALKNNVSELEIEDRPFGRYYSFSMLAGARRDACIANIRSYFNYKYEDEKVLIQSRLEEYLLFNDKCIFVEELAALSQRYAETYGGEEFQLLGVVLHHRKWRKLTDSKSGLVIYDKRQASSSGGWFVQWVLMDLATGSRGRGYEYGDSR